MVGKIKKIEEMDINSEEVITFHCVLLQIFQVSLQFQRACFLSGTPFLGFQHVQRISITHFDNKHISLASSTMAEQSGLYITRTTRIWLWLT